MRSESNCLQRYSRGKRYIKQPLQIVLQTMQQRSKHSLMSDSLLHWVDGREVVYGTFCERMFHETAWHCVT